MVCLLEPSDRLVHFGEHRRCLLHSHGGDIRHSRQGLAGCSTCSCLLRGMFSLKPLPASRSPRAL